MAALCQESSGRSGRARRPVEPGMIHLLLTLCAIGVTASPVPPLYAQQVQPGATQGGPTTGEEMMPPFDMRYFLGNWEIE